MSRAVNMAGKSLAIDLRPRSISVLLHPGCVRTAMTGRFVHMSGEPLPW